MAFRRVAIAQLVSTFPEYEVCDFGHLDDGGVHFNVFQRAGAPADPVREQSLRDRLLALAVHDFGRNFSGEHGIGRANQAAYDQFTPVLVQQYSAAIAAVSAKSTCGSGSLWTAASLRSVR